MPLNAEQRAEINRQNARKSTGPRTEAGKDASRRNGLRHGLRAEVLALPNEDPDVVAERADSWNDYYKPHSPAARHLVNRCVAATLLADRCERYHSAALTKQVHDAEAAFDLEQEERVSDCLEFFPDEPGEAVPGLREFAAGCRWLIARWEILEAALAERGEWTTEELDESNRLQGFRAEASTMKGCPGAWLTRLFGIVTCDRPSRAALAQMFEPSIFPPQFTGVYGPDRLPDRAGGLAALGALVAQNLDALRALEETLRVESEDPGRASAGERALILTDGPTARLFLRYHSESRNAFHRAYGDLVKTLDRDASESEAAACESTASEVPPSEPKAPASVQETPAEPTPPSEAESSPNGGTGPTSGAVPVHQVWPVGTALDRPVANDRPRSGRETTAETRAVA